MNSLLRAAVRITQVIFFLVGVAYPIWMFYLMFVGKIAAWMFGLLVLVPVVPVIPFACAIGLEEVVKKLSR
jgi:hypothetical protein